MRDDLGVYLKILRSAMIELINKDYADFVNLSSNLIGLDKAINNLEIPVGQLREEVMVNYNFAKFTLINLHYCFLEKFHSYIDKYKNLIG